MPPPRTEPVNITAEQAAAARAAGVRRRAQEAEEARNHRWWQDIVFSLPFGAPPLGAAMSGIALTMAGGPPVPALVAIGVGIVAGFIALGLSFVLSEPVADYRLLFPFLVVVIPAVAGAAGTLVFAAFVW